jgi:hypothetical protein
VEVSVKTKTGKGRTWKAWGYEGKDATCWMGLSHLSYRFYFCDCPDIVSVTHFNIDFFKVNHFPNRTADLTVTIYG